MIPSKRIEHCMVAAATALFLFRLPVAWNKKSLQEGAQEVLEVRVTLAQ
jgi:hypothetical protein